MHSVNDAKYISVYLTTIIKILMGVKEWLLNLFDRIVDKLGYFCMTKLINILKLNSLFTFRGNQIID